MLLTSQNVFQDQHDFDASLTTPPVYPNPLITGNFRVEADLEITQIQVYSITGEQILDKNLNDFSNELNITTKGVFILQVQTRDGKIFRSKIINQ